MATAPLSEPLFHSEGIEADFPYRALSRSAIVSLLAFGIALVGALYWPILIFAVFGIGAGLLSLRIIKTFPKEYSGKSLAIAGIVLNAIILAVGTVEHIYIYSTEVPDGYQRVTFPELRNSSETFDIPTPKAMELNNSEIFIKGYIHPSSGQGLLRRFILIADLGTCCFGGQVKSTEMVEVTLTNGQSVEYNQKKLKLTGKFLVDLNAEKSPGLDNGIYYHLRADQLR